MQKIIIEKPYQFIPPHRGNWWPSFIQRFKLIDIYLKRQGIETYECRNSERLRASLDAGHGIMLAPNHARPDDPIAIGWLAREVNTHVYAMASWHLFHQDRFTAWAIRKMGGFSVNREGIDRQSLNTAIEILTQAERPLILFPEGVVSRTNDKLGALLDGVAFLARSAAKRREKENSSHKVVIHPIAIKYLFRGDLKKTLDPILSDIESRLSWRPRSNAPLMERVRKLGFALLTLKEMEYFGDAQTGNLSERLNRLVDRLLQPLEIEWIGKTQSDHLVSRIKTLRMKILPDIIQGDISEQERERRWAQLHDIYLAQQVYSYPPDYLTAEISGDRILETVERYEEDLTDSVKVHGNLHVIMDVGEAITVSPTRDRKADGDPLMNRIDADLQLMLDELAKESRIWQEEP